MAIRLNNRYGVLDGEWLFQYYWQEMGSARSIRKLNRYLQSQGKVNPITHRPLTDMAIWFSLWRWAAENGEKAYQIMNKASADEGKFYSEKEWEEFLEDKMLLIVKRSPKRLARWQNRILKKKTTSA